jgi:hypothetical protein
VAWIMLFITVSSILRAILNVKRKPKISLLVTALVPFTTFYYIGKNGNDEVFIFASIMFFVIVNVLLFKNSLKQA